VELAPLGRMGQASPERALATRSSTQTSTQARMVLYSRRALREARGQAICRCPRHRDLTAGAALAEDDLVRRALR